jgi:hypothetical protein
MDYWIATFREPIVYVIMKLAKPAISMYNAFVVCCIHITLDIDKPPFKPLTQAEIYKSSRIACLAVLMTTVADAVNADTGNGVCIGAGIFFYQTDVTF